VVAGLWLVAVAACELAARRVADFVLVDGLPVPIVRTHQEYGDVSFGTLGGVPIWRRPHPERPTPRAIKTGFRIVLLGDSVVLPALIDARDGLAYLLEEELNARLDGGPYEVVNLSEGGWNTRQEEQVFLHEGLALAPDLVLVGVTANDLQEFAYRGGHLFEVGLLRDLDRVAAGGGLGVLTSRSYLYTLLWLRWKRVEYSTAIAMDRAVETRVIVEPLRRMNRVALDRGARLAMFCFPMLSADRFDPSKDSCPFPSLVEWASTENVPLLDPIPAYARHRNGDLRIDNIHLSVLGHRVLARAAFDWLVGERLVPYQKVLPLTVQDQQPVGGMAESEGGEVR